MYQRKNRVAALFLAIALLLTACGGKETATAMRLVKTEGTVRVENAEGKSVKAVEDLGLYSGYWLTTRTESYGWITLDDAKLAKMDEESEIEIQKKGKRLELYVWSGSLFFNVTEPLAEDETMNIRTSNMAVGIRGTCGWVEVEDDSLMCVYLLRGKVECSVFDKDGSILASETLTEGQAAKMVRDGDSASITVAAFHVDKAPDFVTDELNSSDYLTSSQGQELNGNENSDSFFGDAMDMFGEGESSSASDTIQDDSAAETPMTPEVEEALQQYRVIVGQADSYEYGGWLTGENDSYRYALVQMQTQYTVPALLLKRSPGNGVGGSGILVFQYNPDNGNIIQASGTMNESDRNELTMAGDGNGVLITNYTPSIGASLTTRVVLNGNTLYEETLWQRNGFEDMVPDWTIEEIGHLKIKWYAYTDTEGLDSWTPNN